MKTSTRREFFKQAATIGVAAGTLNFSKVIAENTKHEKLALGMASYTFRKFSLDACIEMTSRLGLKHIALKSHHLPLESSPGEIKNIASKVRDAGLDLYGCGVVYMKNENEVSRAFDYAKTAGIGTIIGVPEHDLLKLVDKKVKKLSLDDLNKIEKAIMVLQDFEFIDDILPKLRYLRPYLSIEIQLRK